MVWKRLRSALGGVVHTSIKGKRPVALPQSFEPLSPAGRSSSVDFASQKYNGTKKFPRARNYGRRRGKPGSTCDGRSPFFTGIEDNHILDDQLDQIVTSFNTLHMSPNTSRGSESGERYSRKVFVGGLPPDIDEGSAGTHLPVHSHPLYSFLANISTPEPHSPFGPGSFDPSLTALPVL
ncbi:translational regulator orb2 [Trichonephila clavipes]|nr:translational regulator orb2 [Trichonephila clavipes]